MDLERLRDELRRRHFLPMVFNFDKPETKDFTETVRLLAGLSSFVIADITNPHYFELIRGAEMRAKASEYTLVLVNAEESAHIELEQIQRLLPSVDGFVLAASRRGATATDDNVVAMLASCASARRYITSLAPGLSR